MKIKGVKFLQELGKKQGSQGIVNRFKTIALIFTILSVFKWRSTSRPKITDNEIKNDSQNQGYLMVNILNFRTIALQNLRFRKRIDFDNIFFEFMQLKEEFSIIGEQSLNQIGKMQLQQVQINTLQVCFDSYFQQSFIYLMISKEENVKKTTGRPQHSTVEQKFITRMKYKKKLMISESNLIVSLYIASPKLSLTFARLSKRVKQQVEVTEPQIEGISIGSVNAERKLMIIKLFSEITKKYVFEDFTEQTMPKKLFSDAQDLSFVFSNILSSQTNSKQIPAEQQIFMGLLTLWKRQELNKELLNYFKQNMEFILKEVKNGIQQLCLMDQSMEAEVGQRQKNQDQEIPYSLDQIFFQFINPSNFEQSPSVLVVQPVQSQKKQNVSFEQNNKHKKIQKQPKEKEKEQTNPRGRGRGQGRGRGRGRGRINQPVATEKKEKQESSGNIQEEMNQEEQKPNKKSKKSKKEQKEHPLQLAINFCKYVCYSYQYAKLPEKEIKDSKQK